MFNFPVMERRSELVRSFRPYICLAVLCLCPFITPRLKLSIIPSGICVSLPPAADLVRAACDSLIGPEDTDCNNMHRIKFRFQPGQDISCDDGLYSVLIHKHIWQTIFYSKIDFLHAQGLMTGDVLFENLLRAGLDQCLVLRILTCAPIRTRDLAFIRGTEVTIEVIDITIGRGASSGY